MLKLTFILVFSFLASLLSDAKATHIIGGIIYYDTLGNNQYKVVIEVYRDCNSSTPFDDPLDYTVFYSDGTVFNTYFIAAPNPTILPVTYDDPCVIAPNDICVERIIYFDTITLPSDQNGYTITYQRCCLTNVIQNIVVPEEIGMTFTTKIPGTDFVSVRNNGARFINYPPLVLCAGNALNFNHVAFDSDGDSLVYTLEDPLVGGDMTQVQPNPESSPPYLPMTWEPGFSATVPFGVGSNLTINAATGAMVFFPSSIGTFIAAVQVKEFRAGILINSTRRTFGYRVVACTVIEPVEVNVVGNTTLIENCGGAGFIITRTDSTAVLVVQISLTGTAINGQDYDFIPDSLTLPIGVLTDTLIINTLFDNLLEDTETVTIYVIIENICDNTFDTTSAIINIVNYRPLEITSLDSIEVCSDFGELGLLAVNVQFGVPPYQYYWALPPLPNNDTVLIYPQTLQPGINYFNATVSDVCNKTIQSMQMVVDNKCPILVPNIITTNEDGKNDLFIIANLEDYESVKVEIFNRWGNLIYTNANYKNDWKGTNKDGSSVVNGTYFYTVTPKSTKYMYDDNERTEFTVTGFLQIAN